MALHIVLVVCLFHNPTKEGLPEQNLELLLAKVSRIVQHLQKIWIQRSHDVAAPLQSAVTKNVAPELHSRSCSSGNFRVRPGV